MRLRDRGEWRAFLERPSKAGATSSSRAPRARARRPSPRVVACIPPGERILTIEDTPELDHPHANHVRLLYAKDGLGIARLGPRELLESALRMRPDRILLQELRDGSAFTYLRTVNSGHRVYHDCARRFGPPRLRAADASREGKR